MTLDDIPRLAKAAGLFVPQEGIPENGALYRFAAFVSSTVLHEHQADIEKWKEAAATAEKWRGIALSKDGNGRTVQAVQAEARAWERNACLEICKAIAIDRWSLYKGRPPYNGTEAGRADNYTQGQSDGAHACAEAIKARETYDQIQSNGQASSEA